MTGKRWTAFLCFFYSACLGAIRAHIPCKQGKTVHIQIEIASLLYAITGTNIQLVISNFE